VIQLEVMTMQSRHRGKYIKDIPVVVVPLWTDACGIITWTLCGCY
jgi:hypothetical protein